MQRDESISLDIGGHKALRQYFWLRYLAKTLDCGTDPRLVKLEFVGRKPTPCTLPRTRMASLHSNVSCERALDIVPLQHHAIVAEICDR